MAQLQNFRSAFNGFNREDVVNYIAYLNNQHSSKVNQLHNQLKAAQDELQALRSAPSMEDELNARIEQLQLELQRKSEQISQLTEEATAHAEDCAQYSAQVMALEEANAALQAQLEQAAQRPQTQEELEAYRRAERAERLANERVAELYAQANGALGEATATVDEVCGQLGGLSQQVIDQLAQLQQNIALGRDALTKASGALYAVKPLSEEE